MLNIRPISDLRNKYTEIEEQLASTGEPIILTKNGYGSMVVLTIEQYSKLIEDFELKLDEADKEAKGTKERLSGVDAFAKARAHLNE